VSLSIAGDPGEWKLFGRKSQAGGEILFRSRTQLPEVQAYMRANPMARIRFSVEGTRGEFEESLLKALEAANAEVCLLATITSDGNRDLFFAAHDLKQLRDAISVADNPGKVIVQFAPVNDADKPKFIKLLTLTPEMEKAAFAQGRARPIPAFGAGKPSR
jgi:hypothetical protein